MSINEIKPIGILAAVSEPPFYDMSVRFIYWDTKVRLREGETLDLTGAKKLYTEEAVEDIIDFIANRLSMAGAYSAGDVDLLEQGIKSTLRDAKAMLKRGGEIND